MLSPVLQLIDGFLLNYNVGDVLVLVTVLGAAAIAFKGSMKLLAIHLVTFGALFLLLPANMLEPGSGSVLGSAVMYKGLGLIILTVAPLVFTVSRE